MMQPLKPLHALQGAASQLSQRVDDELVALRDGAARVHRIHQHRQVGGRLQAGLLRQVEQEVEVGQARRIRLARAALQVLPQLRLACAPPNALEPLRCCM